MIRNKENVLLSTSVISGVTKDDISDQEKGLSVL